MNIDLSQNLVFSGYKIMFWNLQEFMKDMKYDFVEMYDYIYWYSFLNKDF